MDGVSSVRLAGGDLEDEPRAGSGLTRHIKRAAYEPGVLRGDGQAEAAPAGARRIHLEEAIEKVGERLLWDPWPFILNINPRHAVLLHKTDRGADLAMFDCVAHQIHQDPLDPRLVRMDDKGTLRLEGNGVYPPLLIEDLAHDAVQVDLADNQRLPTRVQS